MYQHRIPIPVEPVSAGERRRKVVCVRKSDHLEVSDRRCERLPQVVAVSEPCNMDCEVRCGSMRKNHPENRFPPEAHSPILRLLGGTSLVRVNARLNAAQATAAWTSSV